MEKISKKERDEKETADETDRKRRWDDGDADLCVAFDFFFFFTNSFSVLLSRKKSKTSSEPAVAAAAAAAAPAATRTSRWDATPVAPSAAANVVAEAPARRSSRYAFFICVYSRP
jgi:hypothetical protein